MKSFINRPIPRLLRYELLLKGILEETPPNHDDRVDIPQVLEIIKALGKDTEPGVMTAKQKVELWRYHSNLVFKPTDYTVCFDCVIRTSFSYEGDRISISWTKTDRLFMLGNSFERQTVVWNGMDGLRSMFFSLTITVRIASSLSYYDC